MLSEPRRKFLLSLSVLVGAVTVVCAGNKEMVEKKVEELHTLNRQVLETAVDKTRLAEGDVIVVKAQVLPTQDALGTVKAESVQILDVKVNDKAVPTPVKAEKLVLPEDKPQGVSRGSIKSETINIPNGVK